MYCFDHVLLSKSSQYSVPVAFFSLYVEKSLLPDPLFAEHRVFLTLAHSGVAETSEVPW